MKADQLGQDVDDTSGTNRSYHVDCQAFTRVLIDHRQTLQLLSDTILSSLTTDFNVVM